MKKRCSKCSIEKEITDFHRDRATKDGHRSKCKECSNEHSKKYHSKNRDKILKQKKEYHSKNREKILKRDKERRSRNIGKILKLNKEYYSENTEKILKQKKEYYSGNRDKILKYRKEYSKTENGKLAAARNNHNRRSLCQKERSDITPARWSRILQSQNNKCNICHKKFTKKRLATQDHIIPISQGGGLKSDNMQALCFSCNSRKHAKLDNGYIQTWTLV